jgi:hypothetical protein
MSDACVPKHRFLFNWSSLLSRPYALFSLGGIVCVWLCAAVVLLVAEHLAARDAADRGLGAHWDSKPPAPSCGQRNAYRYHPTFQSLVEYVVTETHLVCQMEAPPSLQSQKDAPDTRMDDSGIRAFWRQRCSAWMLGSHPLASIWYAREASSPVAPVVDESRDGIVVPCPD